MPLIDNDTLSQDKGDMITSKCASLSLTDIDVLSSSVEKISAVKQMDDDIKVHENQKDDDTDDALKVLKSATTNSANDSLIWNNSNSNQQESNLSLVVNAPSITSQIEESVISSDSRNNKSSAVDLNELVLDDERRWLKYRVENLSRDECVIICVLAQMVISDDELGGSRDLIPTDDEAKQALLFLCYGGCWALYNLKTVLDLAEFLPVGLRRLSGLGVRDKGTTSRKLLEGRLEQCLDLSRKLNLQTA